MILVIIVASTWEDPEDGTRGPDTPWKSPVAIGYLWNSGTDPLEKQLDPMGPIASRRRSVMTEKNGEIFWILACSINI